MFPHRAETQELCENKPAISNNRCPIDRAGCGACPGCLCASTVSGNRRCLNFVNVDCPTTDECDTNRDCPGDQVCARVGGCCEGSRRNVCAPPCPTDPDMCPPREP